VKIISSSLFFSHEMARPQTRTCRILLRSQLSTLIRTCRSDVSEGNQQLVINDDELLTLFITIQHAFAALVTLVLHFMTEKSRGHQDMIECEQHSEESHFLDPDSWTVIISS